VPIDTEVFYFWEGMMFRFKMAIVSACLMCLVWELPSGSFGDVVVSNLSEPVRAPTPIGNTQPDEFWATQSFITDGMTYDLDSIQARMGTATNSPTAVFELRKDTGANSIDLTIGGLVTSFTAPDLTGLNSVRNLLPTSSVQLDPNTKYWFVAGVTNNGTFEWEYANTGSFSGPGSLNFFGDSDDAGATWTYRDSPFFPYFIQVNATPTGVPEPTTANILVGFVMLAASRRRLR
jgi:hypothetical protein